MVVNQVLQGAVRQGLAVDHQEEAHQKAIPGVRLLKVVHQKVINREAVEVAVKNSSKSKGSKSGSSRGR
ncbi:MAG: hypothetical protein WKF59_12555 [Chitinophagaceae bacterium]